MIDYKRAIWELMEAKKMLSKTDIQIVDDGCDIIECYAMRAGYTTYECGTVEDWVCLCNELIDYCEDMA